MKPRHTITALVAVIAVATCFLLAPAKPPDGTAPAVSPDAGEQAAPPVPPAGRPGKDTAAKSSSGESNKRPGINWERFARLMESGSSSTPGDPWPQPTAADLDRFIAKRGESAANL